MGNGSILLDARAKHRESKVETLSPSEVAAKLNVLTELAQNLRLPYGHGTPEPWWRVVSVNVTDSTIARTRSIFEARRAAASYALDKISHLQELNMDEQRAFDAAELNVMRMLRTAAKGAGLEKQLSDGALRGYEAVWATNMVGIGYEPAFGLKGMMLTVEHLAFKGKEICIDFVEERMDAINVGFIPVTSVRGELIVCKIEQFRNF